MSERLETDVKLANCHVSTVPESIVWHGESVRASSLQSRRSREGETFPTRLLITSFQFRAAVRVKAIYI